MPDKFDHLLDRKLDAAADNNKDDFSSKLQREAELLRDGLSKGALSRVVEMWENPGQTALTLGSCAALGAALNIANRAGGRWGTAAKFVGAGLAITAGYDVVNRASNTFGAIGDTWSSAANLEHSKDRVAQYAGSALVDYPLMIAAGYGGHTLGRVRGFGVKIEIGNYAQEVKFGEQVRFPEPASTRPFEFNVNRYQVPAGVGDIRPSRFMIPPIVPTELLHPAKTELLHQSKAEIENKLPLRAEAPKLDNPFPKVVSPEMQQKR